MTSVTGMIDLSGLVEEHRAAVEALVNHARNGHPVALGLLDVVNDLEWPEESPGDAGKTGEAEAAGDLPRQMLELPAGPGVGGNTPLSWSAHGWPALGGLARRTDCKGFSPDFLLAGRDRRARSGTAAQLPISAPGGLRGA